MHQDLSFESPTTSVGYSYFNCPIHNNPYKPGTFTVIKCALSDTKNKNFQINSGHILIPNCMLFIFVFKKVEALNMSKFSYISDHLQQSIGSVGNTGDESTSLIQSVTCLDLTFLM